MSTNDFNFFLWLELLGLDEMFGEKSWPILDKKVWEYYISHFVLMQDKKEFDKFPLLMEKHITGVKQ